MADLGTIGETIDSRTVTTNNTATNNAAATDGSRGSGRPYTLH